MTNRAFLLSSDVDKQKKLIMILRRRTRNALSGKEMRAIARCIKANQQYTVQVHTDPEKFGKALVLVRKGALYDYGEIIYGQAWFGISGYGSSKNGQILSVQNSAAAQIVRYEDDKAERHALHIYIPQRHYRQEGSKHEKRR